MASSKRQLIHRLVIVTFGFLMLLLALFPIASHVSAASPATTISQPRQVTVDIYVINIGNLNQQQGSFDADMYLSFAWSGNWSATSNNSSEPALPSHFDLTNGQVNQVELVYSEQNASGSGINYLEYRIHATLFAPFSFHRFPLDKQQLSIRIEDNHYGNSSLVYVADSQSKLDSSVQVPGWVIQKGSQKLLVSTHVYNSSFVYPNAPNAYAYSQIAFAFSIARPISTALLDFVLPSVVLIALIMTMFRIRMESFDIRLEVGVINIFAAVAFLLALDNGIPAGYLTIADQAMVILFGATLFAIAESVWIHRLDEEKSARLTENVDRISFISVPLVVLALLLGVLVGVI